MKPLAWALLFHISGAAWLLDGPDEPSACSLIQAGARRQSPERGVCVDLSPKDLTSPIGEVVERHGVDGWCVFGQLGPWSSSCALARQRRDVRGYGIQDDMPITEGSMPVTLKFFDNRSLTIRDHIFPLDDVYCYVNNWCLASLSPFMCRGVTELPLREIQVAI